MSEGEARPALEDELGRVLINTRNLLRSALSATLRLRISTPTLTVVQKIALTAIVDQAHNSN